MASMCNRLVADSPHTRAIIPHAHTADLRVATTQQLGYPPVTPTVLRGRGFDVRVYPPPREHGPAHVHVVKDDAEVVIMREPH